MIPSFSQFLVEEERAVYFTFGRMNPPTTGHGKLMDMLAAKAGKSPYRVYLSQTQDSSKNPLSYADKIKHVRKMFPKHARSVIINKKIRQPLDAVVQLYNEGFKTITMLVGSDRVTEFDVMLNKYNGKEHRHGFYNFKKINVVSAGTRDPDSEGVDGTSSTKQRELARVNEYVEFGQGVPKSMSNSDTRKMFNDVRVGMGLKEEKSFKNHISLASVSETREAFVRGRLFDLGEQVIIKDTDEVATIVVLGSNYVIVEKTDGTRFRKWIDAIESVETKDKVVVEAGEMERARNAIARDKTRSAEASSREKEKQKIKHDQLLDKARRAVAIGRSRGIKP